MKKTSLISIVMLMMFTGICFAQEATENIGSGGHPKKMKMGYMMMKKMMQKEMVATKDGGVIVLAGNKLMKYDKDLNLVKEVEIKIDMEGMANKMKECMETMKKCGMDMSETSE